MARRLRCLRSWRKAFRPGAPGLLKLLSKVRELLFQVGDFLLQLILAEVVEIDRHRFLHEVTI
jgi:hypothetical protein